MPKTARIVPIVFAVVIFSLRNIIPITKAKIIEVVNKFVSGRCSGDLERRQQ